MTVLSPNKPLQRSGLDKVLGRGRGVDSLEQVLRARVLKGQWPAAETGLLGGTGSVFVHRHNKGGAHDY
jgi:hypothetical protein